MKRSRCAILALAALAGCRDLADADAEALVRAYNGRVIEAFRTGDARLIDPVTGPTDGKRLAGLIGAKTDMGITLDAKLLELQVLGVEHPKGEVAVLTEERWTYRDRRIGTGEQVGEASNDHYFMRYHLRKPEGRWVVDEIAFERDPVVGRKAAPVTGTARAFHGVMQTVPPPRGAEPAQATGEPPATSAGGKSR